MDLTWCIVPLKSRGMCLSSAVLDRKDQKKSYGISAIIMIRRLKSQISLLQHYMRACTREKEIQERRVTIFIKKVTRLSPCMKLQQNHLKAMHRHEENIKKLEKINKSETMLTLQASQKLTRSTFPNHACQPTTSHSSLYFSHFLFKKVQTATKNKLLGTRSPTPHKRKGVEFMCMHVDTFSFLLKIIIDFVF